MENNQNLPQEVHGTEVTFIIPDTESLGQLKEMKEYFKLTTSYKTADDWARIIDQEVRAYYMGMTDIPNDKGEAVKCARFISETECFISGQMTLIEAVKNLPTQTPIAITYRGKRTNKSSEGSTMLFEVVTLR